MDKFGTWSFNKEMLAMGAGFLLWVIYQTWDVSTWKAQTDNQLRQLSAQTLAIADREDRTFPDHERRIIIMETQLISI